MHRPSTLQPNETRSIWKAGPPVLEFDVDGSLVSSWGGPGTGYDWPQLEHGIYVDGNDNVWLGGIDPKQTFLFINDGTNQLIYVLNRATLQIVSTFGGAGHWAGQFYGAHVLA